MNWYCVSKYEEGLKVLASDDYGYAIDPYLEELYELEYKYNTTKNNQFDGHPRRKENMLKRWDARYNLILPKVLEPIKRTFDGWLDRHALLEPDKWAKGRLQEYSDDGMPPISGAIYEYDNLREVRTTDSDAVSAERAVFSYISNNMSEFPSWQRMIDRINRDNEIMHDEEEEGPFYPVSLSEFLFDYGYEIEWFEEYAESMGLETEMAEEIYKNIVFPVWIKIWKGQGIEGVRSNIESVRAHLDDYDKLSLESGNPWLSLAIQTVHMSGNVLTDYMNEYGGVYVENWNLFDYVEDLDTDVWDDELREMGVKV
jgi:hypothetical protein